MDTKYIVILFCISAVLITVYLHYKKYVLITEKPSIEQSEYFHANSIRDNHKKTKNIFIIRLYSTFDENKKILDIVYKSEIKAYSQLNIKDKRDEEILTIESIANGNSFSDNMMSYILQHVKHKSKIPTIDGIFSPLSVSKNIFINVGMKLQKIPVMLMSQYDRLFLHIVKGGVRIRLYDPTQKKHLYIDREKKIHMLKNVTNSFRNSKMNLENKNINAEFPKFSNAEFTEIIVREGNLVYIPNFWIFTMEYLESSVCLFYASNTLISSLYNMTH